VDTRVYPIFITARLCLIDSFAKDIAKQTTFARYFCN
jgi:hypothetical protein